MEIRNHKLFDILRSFSNTDLKEFGKFVRSPFHNNSNSAVKLFSVCKKYHPGYNSESLTKEKLFSSIYPGRKYKVKTIKNLLTLTTALAKNYITYSSFKNDSILFKKVLLKELCSKNLSKFFDNETELSLKLCSLLPVNSKEYFFNKHEIENLKRIYLERNTITGKSTRIYELLQSQAQNLINFFLITLFEEYLQILSGERIVKTDALQKNNDNFIHKIFYLSKKIDHIPLLEMYRKLISLRLNPSDKTYNKIAAYIKKTEKNISKPDLNLFYGELMNYSIRRLNSGEKSFGAKLFGITKLMLEKEMLLEEAGTMLPHNYVNINAIALREGEIEWAEKFTAEYSELLPADTRENPYIYNMGTIYYTKARAANDRSSTALYNKALNILSKFKSSDFYEKIRLNNLLLKIYYELNAYETAASLIDTYRKYLKKNTKTIPDHLEKNYVSFINFTEKLFKIKAGSLKIPFSKIQKELKASDNFDSKGWIESHLQKLEGIK